MFSEVYNYIKILTLQVRVFIGGKGNFIEVKLGCTRLTLILLWRLHEVIYTLIKILKCTRHPCRKKSCDQLDQKR
jgi:hypothetical protein